MNSIAECEYRERFEKSLVFSFDETQDMSPITSNVNEYSIEAVLLPLYPNTQQECNPEFGVFQSIQLFLM